MKVIDNDLHESGRPLTKEEFIELIKTDDAFAEKWGELGSVYGKQWRRWETKKQTSIRDGSFPNGEYKWKYGYETIDQIQNMIDTLKKNPDSRRIMVNAWNVAEVDSCVLPPCHYGFQVWTRELSLVEKADWIMKNRTDLMGKCDYLDGDGKGIKSIEWDHADVPQRAISLMWNQRSCDTLLGIPFNIASYGFLLEIIAKEVNMVPDELIGCLGDTHLYLNHIEQALEQISREPYDLPTLSITEGDGQEFGCTKELYLNNFNINGYKSHPKIDAPLSN